MEEDPSFIIRVAVPADVKYVYTILYEMERSERRERELPGVVLSLYAKRSMKAML